MNRKLSQKDTIVYKMGHDGLIEKNVSQNTESRKSKREEEVRHGSTAENNQLSEKNEVETEKTAGKSKPKQNVIKGVAKNPIDTSDADEKKLENVFQKALHGDERDTNRQSRVHNEKTESEHHYENEETSKHNQCEDAERGNDHQVVENTDKTRKSYDKKNEQGIYDPNDFFRKKQLREKHKIEHKVFEDEYTNQGVRTIHRGYRKSVRNYKNSVNYTKYLYDQKFIPKHAFVDESEKYKRKKRHIKKKLQKGQLRHDLRYSQHAFTPKKKTYKEKLSSLKSQKEKYQRTTNPIQKQIQKKKYKKVYATMYRNGGFNKKKGQFIINAIKKTLAFFRNTYHILVAFGGTFLIFAVMMVFFSSCSIGLGIVVTTAIYPSDDIDLTTAAAYYKEKEADLEYRIDHIEEEFSGYDEYWYQLGDIGHDSIVLLSYLSVKFEDFTLSEVQGELDRIFNEQYHLTCEEIVERRERTVTNQQTGETHTEVYDYYILEVTLEVKDLTDILRGMITDPEDEERFDIYNDTAGGHQVYSSPFDFDWMGNISSHFGYRIHPITGEKKLHAGIDIALPEGTPIQSVMNGKVITAQYSESAGNFIVIEDASGCRTRYLHCHSLNVKAGDIVKKGDTIGTVGTTGASTGNHLHLEVIEANGNYLNPFLVISSYHKSKQEE